MSQLEKIAQLTGQGLSNREIGEAIGRSKASVQRIKKTHGIPSVNHRLIPAADWKTVERLLDEGASASEAARTIGRTTQAVLAKFPGRGWTPRQSNEHRRVLHGKAWSAASRAESDGGAA